MPWYRTKFGPVNYFPKYISFDLPWLSIKWFFTWTCVQSWTYNSVAVSKPWLHISQYLLTEKKMRSNEGKVFDIWNYTSKECIVNWGSLFVVIYSAIVLQPGWQLIYVLLHLSEAIWLAVLRYLGKLTICQISN